MKNVTMLSILAVTMNCHIDLGQRLLAFLFIFKVNLVTLMSILPFLRIDRLANFVND